jgi:predicted trehalose synthase
MPARLDRETTQWLSRQRWFAAKTHRITEAVIEDRIPVDRVDLCLLRVVLDDGTAHRYVAALSGNGGVGDAFADDAFCRALLGLMGGAREARGQRGTLRGHRFRAFPRELPMDVRVRRLLGEQSNTSVIFDSTVIVKHFRHLTEGENPELEITRFLTEHTTFHNTPRLAGALEYIDAGGTTSTLAVAQELVPDGRDGWQWLLDRLAAGEGALDALRRLGRRTAELHLALATPTADPAFGAEPIGRSDLATWTAAVDRQVAAARAAVAGHRLPEAPAAAAAAALAGLLGANKLRHHGDFHLGQTLCLGDGADFMLIDFEGEPLRPLAERRRKHTPLRDVAGMLRSFAYAAATMARGGRNTDDWESGARAAFLDGYRAAAGDAAFIPAGDGAFARAVAALELEKAAYEIVYEANNRPDWIDIPVRGFVSAAASLARVAGAA